MFRYHRTWFDNYTRYNFRGFHLVIPRETPDALFLERCCFGPPPGDSGVTPVVSSANTRIYRFAYRQEIYFHKTFLPRNWFEPVKEFFLRSRAERALRGDLLLQANGFAVAGIVVVGRKGAYNFIVTRAVPHPLKLRQYFQQTSFLPKSSANMARHRNIIRQLGRSIGKMHSRGIAHGDLRWGNILVDDSDTVGACFLFMDNERTVQYRHLPRRKILKNLVQLNMTLENIISWTDRLRFFQAYQQENPRIMAHRREWITRVLRKTKKRLSRRLQKRPSQA